jgi:hypothetical protein
MVPATWNSRHLLLASLCDSYFGEATEICAPGEGGLDLSLKAGDPLRRSNSTSTIWRRWVTGTFFSL